MQRGAFGKMTERWIYPSLMNKRKGQWQTGIEVKVFQHLTVSSTLEGANQKR